MTGRTIYKPGMKIPAKAVLAAHHFAPLFWEFIPPPKYPRKITQGIAKEINAQTFRVMTEKPSKARRKTRPCKSLSNPNNIHLKDCWTFAKKEDYLSPRLIHDLDNILTGISVLDLGGNTRPVRKDMLFDMLRDLDEINVQTVKDYTDLSESHCRKLAGLLRVAVNALERLTKGSNHDDGLPLRIPISENTRSLDCLPRSLLLT